MTEEPSQDIARREPTDTWVDVIGPVAKLADYVSQTAFVPKAMIGKPAAVAATILAGRELGWGPMTSLRSLDVIEGSVQMKTKAILARMYTAGHRVDWITVTDKACEVRITRADGLTSASAKWTLDDALRADLLSKTNWRRYPRQMLRNRALSEAAELACPDVLLGLDIAPEVMADDVQPQRSLATVVQVQRTPEPEVPQPAAEPAVEVADADPDPEPTPAPTEPTPAPETPLVTPRQIRKIGALIGDWESVAERKLDRSERRRMIGFMAGVPDPEALESANHLTEVQASTAIDALIAEVDAMRAGRDVVDAELVADELEE